MVTALVLYVLIGLLCLAVAAWWSGDDGYSLGPAWAVVALWPLIVAAVALEVLAVLFIAAAERFGR